MLFILLTTHTQRAKHVSFQAVYITVQDVEPKEIGMAKFFEEESHTFSEYLLVPGYSSSKNIPSNVSLETPLVRYAKGEKPSITMHTTNNRNCNHPT